MQMAERSPESGDDGGATYERERGRRVPRWVKVAGIVAAVVVLLVVIVMLMSPGGGEGHTPRRHGLASGAGPQVAATTVHMEW
jgi:hypothetical protein